MTPIGQLPKSLEVVLNGELIDQIKPGDRIDITGIYKSFPNSATI